MPKKTPRLVSVAGSATTSVASAPTLSSEEEQLLEALRAYRYPGADSFIRQWREGKSSMSLFELLRQEIKPLHELFNDLDEIEERFAALAKHDSTGMLVAEFAARVRRITHDE